MTIGQGTAFGLSQEADRYSGIPVEKRWEILDGRTFLIEEVPFRRLKPLLRNLQASLVPTAGNSRLASDATSPGRQATASSSANASPSLPRLSPSEHPIEPPANLRGVLSQKLLLPPIRKMSVPSKGSIRIADALPETVGLVLDFNLVNATNMVFQGDTTYVVASYATVNLSGTSVIEGGCVVKFDRGAGINFLGPVQCLTGPYRPALFTCVDDDSVGTQVTGSAHSPSGRYAACAISLGVGGDLKYLNVRYAEKAIYCATSAYWVSHSQFLFCDVGLYSDTTTFYNYNVLMYQVTTNYYGTYFEGFIEHLTSDQADTLAMDPDFPVDLDAGLPSSTLSLVNTLTASITNGYGLPFDFFGKTVITTDHVQDFPTSDGLFQSIGGGSHYLCVDSTNRHAGTTATLFGDLRNKTTYPPTDLSTNDMTVDTVLSPCIPRETGAPDLGFAYDPLDYAIRYANVSSNLTVTPGTAIGFYGGEFLEGLNFLDGAKLVSLGYADSLNHFVRYNLVQEQATTNWSSGVPGPFITSQNPVAATIDCHFTDFSTIGGEHISWGVDGDAGQFSFRDCQFHGGRIELGSADTWVYFYGLTAAITNCLFERTAILFLGGSEGFNVTARNNLFWNCSVACDDFDYEEADPTTLGFTDNLFDHCSISQTTNVTLTAGYNAYITGCDRLMPTNSHDVILTNTDYQVGPFGNYYYPTNGGMLSRLIDAGSTNASLLGLLHYTTQTNELDEGTSTVDIGFHYGAILAPSIAVQPASQTVIQNANASFIVTAISPLLPSYQWRFNGTNIAGATTSAYTRTTAHKGFDDGNYAVLITNSAGSVTSDAALLTIIVPPLITQPPHSLSVVQGTNIVFSVGVSNLSTLPLSYQWQWNGTDVPAATGSSYSKIVVAPTNSGTYSVTVSNVAGSTNISATLAVYAPVFITTLPTDQTVIQGSTATFAITADGTSPGFQWMTNSINLTNNSHYAGVKSNSLSIANITTADHLSYSVMVTNPVSSAGPVSASLNVVVPPTITNLTVSPWPVVQAANATFTAASTDPNATYQWQFISVDILGATSPSFTRLVMQTTDAGQYSVVVANIAGTTNRSTNVSVIVPPIITNQPSSLTINQGSNATFTVSADGTPPLGYYWYTNDTSLITWEPNFLSSLTVTNVQPGDAGNYSVVVSNIAGTNLSIWASLSVISTGGITNGPVGGASTNGILVSMTQPNTTVSSNAAVYALGQSIDLRATARTTDRYSYITSVAFYGGTNLSLSDSNLLGTAVVGANTTYAWRYDAAKHGTNWVTAVASDNNGHTRSSSVVYFIMNETPQVTSIPASTNMIWEGCPISLWVTNTVTDDGWPHSKTNISWIAVDFDVTNLTQIYTNNSIIVTALLTFTNYGTHTWQLNASDDSASGSGISVINIKHRPVVTITSPTNNAAFLTGTPIALNATAIDPDGSVNEVKFYGNTTNLLGTAFHSAGNTYALGWYGAPVGTNLVTAVATDNDVLSSTSSPVAVIVHPYLEVYFVQPTNDQLFVASPTNIFLNAAAISYIGAPASVTFSNNLTNLGSGIAGTYPTFHLLWQDATNGTYTLTVNAADNQGNTASDTVTNIIVNAMPAVSIITPTNIQSFPQGTNVLLSASAHDADGDNTITRVQFFCYTNLVWTNLGSLTSTGANGLYNLTWSNLSAGTYPITAVATDDRGASSSSSITVFKVTPTTPAPIVWITYPTNGAAFFAGTTITITANATSFPASVTNVEFFVNGASIGSDPTEPYAVTECCWMPGNYVLLALARDSFGSSSVSTQVNITISNSLPTGTGFWDPTFFAPADACAEDPTKDINISAGVLSTAVQGANVFYTTAQGSGPGLPSLWRWDGTNWFHWYDLPPCSDFPFLAEGGQLAVSGSVVYVAGGLADDSGYAVEQLVGTNWTQLGGTFVEGRHDDRLADPAIGPRLQFLAGDLYIYGNFTGIYTNHVEDTNLQYIARWDAAGSNWVQVGSPLNGPVLAISSLNGHLVIGGMFTQASGNTNANHVAELVGTDWTNLGTGVSGTNYSVDESYYTGPPLESAVFSLAACGNNLFVGGDFTTAGSVTNASGIASWNGREWKPIGGGLQGAQNSIGECSSLSSYTNPIVLSIAARGDVVYAGGSFAYALNGSNALPVANIAKATWSEDTQQWTWSDLEYGLFLSFYDAVPVGAVLSLSIMEGPTSGNYDLIAGGSFYSSGSQSPLYNIARWRVGYPQPASLPTVAITSPTNSTFYTNIPADIPITATANSTYTNIAKVGFYVDGSLVVSQATNSFYYDWTTPPVGPHLLTAVATDRAGLQGKSAPVLINIRDTNSTVTAVDDTFVVILNDPPATLDVLANDTGSNNLHILQVYQIQAASGAAQVSFDGSSIIFHPTPNAYGTNIFLYWVTDTVSTNSAYVTVSVLAKPNVALDLSPSSVRNRYTTNASITISAHGWDYDGSVTNIILFNGTNTLGQTNGPDLTVSWSTNVFGFYRFVAVATDNDGLTNSSFPVTVNITNVSTATNVLTAYIGNLADTPNGLGGWVYPVVRDGFFDLRGQARDSDTNNPVTYQLQLVQADDQGPENPSFVSANVTPQPRDAAGLHTGGDTNGDLGILDLTGVPNGIYDLQLIVYSGGEEADVTVRFRLESNLRIGQFSFTEQDLVIPVNGIPLTVMRTYNSLNPRSADFGYSWSFALNAMDVQLDDVRRNVTIGTPEAPFADDEEDDNGLPKVVSIRTGGGHDVTLTLPDGRRTTFAFAPRLGSSYATAEWKPPADVHATLAPLGLDTIEFFPTHWAAGGENSTFETHDVPGWVLETQDGTRFTIERGSPNRVIWDDTGDSHFINVLAYGPPKLTSIVQRSGDTIQIKDNGIFHYANRTNLARSTLFDRDSQGRITAIYDPNSGATNLQLSTLNLQPVVKYVYNRDTGNLIQVLKLVDRTAGTYVTNKYHYDNPNFPHYITSIENPLGIPVARNEYDDDGRLTAVVDADGNRTEFDHSTTNRMERVIDRLGHTNTFAYDPRGNITAKTNALGGITLAAYDDNNNKTNEVAFLNGAPYATNSHVFDTRLNVMLSSTDPLGNIASFTYDQTYGLLLTSTDARNNTSTNYYDPATGHLLATSDALGNVSSNFFNDRGLLAGTRDPIGTLTSTFFDDAGNVLATVALDSSGTILSTNSFGYDANGNQTTSVTWRQVNGVWVGATNITLFDAQNRATGSVDALGYTNLTVLDPAGLPTQTIDKLGRVTTFVRDFQERVIQTIYPNLTTETAAFDAAGNRISSTDRTNRTTFYIPDALNRLTQTVFPDGTSNHTVLDDLGRVRFTVDAKGITNAFGYDLTGRRVAVTNGFGTPQQMVYGLGFDANGNQIYSIDPSGVGATNIFDPLNRQVEARFADGTHKTTVFDAVGRKIAEGNQDSITNLFDNDGLGRLTAVTNAFGTTNQMVTRYVWDEAGNEIAQIDANNHTNGFGYNLLGERVWHKMPDGTNVEWFAYDPVGNQILHTNFNGVVVTNDYNEINQLTNVSSVAGFAIGFAYTATGQRAIMTDGSGTTSYEHDSRDRLTEKTVSWTGGPTISLSYAYDLNGNVTNIWSSSTNGVNLVYQLDALNRITNVIANGSSAASYGFDPSGNLHSVRYGNGVTNLSQYDLLNRLTNSAWKSNLLTLASFYYQLGATGNRTNLTETMLTSVTNRTYAWHYDLLYRLQQETISGLGSVGYGFDLVGNRTNRNSSIAGLTNQISTFSADDLLGIDRYDRNGNTTNSCGNSYQYDPLNRLTNFNNGAVFLAYDGDGKRVKKTAGSTNFFYLIDDGNPSGYGQVLEEWTVSTTATNLNRVYNWGLALVSQRDPGGSTSYFIFDGHGSTRVLADNGGTIVNAFAFDAYGNLIASNTAPQTVYLYNCQQFDPNLGSYNLRARTYDPGTGRFPTADLIEGDQEDPLSLHRYTYCGADPVNNGDPLGSTWQTDFGRAVEEVIRNDFWLKDTPHRFEDEVALSTLLGQPYTGVYRQRLDLAHQESGNNYFFEIKHCTPAEIVKGYRKITRYSGVLGPQWRPGTISEYTYGTGNLPLIKTDVNGVPLPGGYYALVLPPVHGLITYVRVKPKTPIQILKVILALSLATARVAPEAGAIVAEMTATSETAAGLVGAGAGASEIGAVTGVAIEAEALVGILGALEGVP